MFAYQAAHFGNMGLQAAQLFIHIGFLHKNHKFLFDAIIINVRHRIAQTLFGFVDVLLQQMRKQLHQGMHNVVDVIQPRQQMLLQLFAFART